MSVPLIQPLLTRRLFNKTALQSVGGLLIGLALPATLSACANPQAHSSDDVLLKKILQDKFEQLTNVNQVLTSVELTPQEIRALETIKKNHADHLATLIQFTGLPTPTATNSAPSDTSLSQVVQASTQAAALRSKQVAQLSDPQAKRLICLIGACESVHEFMAGAHV